MPTVKIDSEQTYWNDDNCFHTKENTLVGEVRYNEKNGVYEAIFMGERINGYVRKQMAIQAVTKRAIKC